MHGVTNSRSHGSDPAPSGGVEVARLNGSHGARSRTRRARGGLGRKPSLRPRVARSSRLIERRVGEAGARYLRFTLVGGSGLVVNTVAFVAFAKLAGLHYLTAALLATQCSTLWNFVLSDLWVFRGSRGRSLGARAGLFFAMNNLTLLLRSPLLVLLVAALRLEPTLANLLTLLLLSLVRFGFADTLIWAPAAAPRRWCYSVHDIVTVESPVRLPELERFRVDELRSRPTIRVRLGKLNGAQSELVNALAFIARHSRYDERLGRFGFAVEISIGKSIEILASPLLRRSPHVLYTNVVEPVLRWTFVKKGYALTHGACIAFGDRAYLITARTDTGKTTTVLRMLDAYRCGFLSDDLTLVTPEGKLLTYPKPLTISRHTVGALRDPQMSRREWFALWFQSRVHSRSGRRFAMLLARLKLPVATINALVQLVVPPPKYDVTRLVPSAKLVREASLNGLIVIERGSGVRTLGAQEAVETLIQNTEDAYGSPPYPAIEHFLHSGNGRDLRAEERAILAQALDGVGALAIRSQTMDWWRLLPDLLDEQIEVEEKVPTSVEAEPLFQPAPA